MISPLQPEHCKNENRCIDFAFAPKEWRENDICHICGCDGDTRLNPTAGQDKVLKEKFIEIGNLLAPYLDENHPLYVGSVMTPAGQALRTVMESLRPSKAEQP